MEAIVALKTHYCEWLDGKRWDHWAGHPGRLRVVWEMKDRVQTPLYDLDGAGFYEDHYVQTGDGWKIAGVRLHRNKVELRPKSPIMRAILWMHENGWLRQLSRSADQALGEALHVGLAPGQKP